MQSTTLPVDPAQFLIVGLENRLDKKLPSCCELGKGSLEELMLPFQ